MDNQKADELLAMPKKVYKDNSPQDRAIIRQEPGLELRLELVAEKANYVFLWEIRQSRKLSVRLSLHLQENDTNIGLLRVDFNCGHKNPEIANSFVPEKIKPFAGKRFSLHEHHIHYHVQGYKTLAWAVPLTADKFEVKELQSGPEFNNDLERAIKTFAKTISLETEITLDKLLL